MRRESNKLAVQARNWFLVLVLLGLIILLTRSVIVSAQKVKTSKGNLSVVVEEYEQIFERQKSIEDLLSAFENDFGFEKYVRENFGVVKPGEKVVIIVDNQNNEVDNSGQD